ncbi:MAG TPA: hypothetical protein VHC45_06210 [Gaiellaceae bacterium]|nr:hypothetical protein [Gaiellaceae bacterium]
MRTPPLLAGIALLSLALVGCGSRAHPPAATRLPAGFVPQAMAATGAGDFWLLGRTGCDAGRCFAVARTADGGRSFTTSAAPSLPANGDVPELERSGADDGFLLVPGLHPLLYATHDGARTWRRSTLQGVLAFTTAGGSAYAVTARCSRAGCVDYRFARAPASGGAWHVTRLPFAPDGSVLELAARSDDVWLLATAAGGRTAGHDVLARSTDAGRTFAWGAGPCVPGLGGELAPAGGGTVWAVCPTGMEAGAWRSSDGGVRFAAVRTPELVNSAELAPASPDVAALVGSGTPARILHTDDGGATWATARTPRGATSVASLAFVDAKVGYALAQTGWNAQAKVQRVAVWRTTDGGASWARVRLR